MKRFLLVLTLAAMPLTARAADLGTEFIWIEDSAPAQPAVVGHIQLGIAYLDQTVSVSGDIPPPTGDEPHGLFEGAARGNIDFGWLNLELEVAGSAVFGSDGSSSSSIGTVGHFWRGTDDVALGFVGGVLFPSGGTEYFLGTEAEAYLSAATFGGDFRYFWEESSGSNDEYWIGRGWLDFYVTPNARIGGRVAYVSYDDGDGWFGSVTGEYRFAGSPISAWISGQYLDEERKPCPGCKVEAETWLGLVGLRVFMDADGTTLQEHDRLVPWQSLNSIR